MKIIYICLLCTISISSLGETPKHFRVQCEVMDIPIAFEYNHSMSPNLIGIGFGENSKELKDMAAYDLEAMGYTQDDYFKHLKYFKVNFTTRDIELIGQDEYILHLLTVNSESGAVSWKSITLNRDKTKLLSDVTFSSREDITSGRLNNCLSIGVW